MSVIPRQRPRSLSRRTRGGRFSAPVGGENAWVLGLGLLLAGLAGIAAGNGEWALAILIIGAPAFIVLATAAPERTALGLLVLLPFMIYPTTVGRFSVYLAVPLFGYVSLVLTLRQRAALRRLRGILPVAAFGLLALIAIVMAALSDDLAVAFSRVLYLVLFGWFAGVLALTLLSGRLTREAVAKSMVWAGALGAAAVLVQFAAQFVGSRESVMEWMQNLYPQFGGQRAAQTNLHTSNWVLNDPEVLRGVFPFMAPPSAGQFLMLALVAGIWLRRERKTATGAGSVLQLALLVLIGAALLATFSRQAWLGAAVGIVALGIRRRPAWTLGVVAVSLLAVAVVPIPGGSGSFGQYLLTASDTSTTSSASRLNLWTQALDLIPEHAVIGIGPGLFGTLNPTGHGVYYAHNVFLDAAVELGIVGALALLAVFLSGLRSALRRSEMLAFGLLAAYVVAGLFDDVLLFPRNGLLLAAAFALIAGGPQLRGGAAERGRTLADENGSATVPLRQPMPVSLGR